MSVAQVDAIMATSQPHKLLATASRLTGFGSRRDLLGDPSAPYVERNPNGLSLDRVLDRYRAQGLITGDATGSGSAPDEVRRAAAIVLDCLLDNYPSFLATFPEDANRARLRQLTEGEAFGGSDPQKFAEWVRLAKNAEMEFLIAASQDIAAVTRAASELLASTSESAAFRYSISTKWGDIVLDGSGSSTYLNQNLLLCIDIGGDDTYINCPTQKHAGNWVAIVIDRSGNDRYLSDPTYAESPVREGANRTVQRRFPGPGAGFFGISLILDSAGDDLYRSSAQAFGSGTFGVGYLLDSDGTDTYDAYTNSLGFGFFGLGILEDETGDDNYRIFQNGQGCGFPAGIGWLIDRRGNDTYAAEDEVKDFPSPQTADHNVSMVQGAGYGVRLDYINGQSLAGGVGMLFDLAGNDRYTCGVFGQGVGYWMGLGALWDRDGKDSYAGVWYVQGAAAHFATGFLQDDAGDDTYSASINMSNGAGHDFSFGLQIDFAGNDSYSGGGLALGAGNANGIGGFFDLDGNDVYKATQNTSIGFGAPSSEQSLRKYSLCLGVFFDRHGNDRYTSPNAYVSNGGRVANRASGDGVPSLGIFWDQ